MYISYWEKKVPNLTHAFEGFRILYRARVQTDAALVLLQTKYKQIYQLRR